MQSTTPKCLQDERLLGTQTTRHQMLPVGRIYSRWNDEERAHGARLSVVFELGWWTFESKVAPLAMFIEYSLGAPGRPHSTPHASPA